MGRFDNQIIFRRSEKTKMKLVFLALFMTLYIVDAHDDGASHLWIVRPDTLVQVSFV